MNALLHLYRRFFAGDAVNDPRTLLARCSGRERLIQISLNCPPALGAELHRCNDVLWDRDACGTVSQSMTTGHGGVYRVTRLAPVAGKDQQARAVYGVRIGPQIVAVEQLATRGRSEYFQELRLADDPTRPNALGEEYRVHHYDPLLDGFYRTSRRIEYADGSVETFAVLIAH